MKQVGSPLVEQPTDEQLLRALAGGESDALAQLYDRYARVVFSVALRMLGTPELAEDVVQETFWRVWRRGAAFQTGRGQVSSWIYGIAHNLCIDELRRQRVRPQSGVSPSQRDELLAVPDASVDVVGSALEAERRRLIVGALAQLPPEQRRAIELAYFGGLSQSEIADTLQSPIGTIKARVRLGLRRLRELLEASEGQGPESEARP
jgi:RNA polymerase sigma-70 factor (ECF subfamily)